MLKKLLIEQFVIIDRLEIEFRPDLTVLTGETGAGKSILLDALGLMLGDPPNFGVVRLGAERSVIEAVFAPPSSSPAWKILSETGLISHGDTDFIIRRVLEPEDKDIITINGKAVDVDILKKLGASLGEIHGQFANQSLLDPSNQMNLLDLSGAFPPEIFANVAEHFHNFHRYAKEREAEAAFYAKHIQSLSKFETLVGKMDAAGLKEHPVEEIKAEYGRLLTAQQTYEAFQEMTSYLIASNGAIKALTSASMALARQKNLDAEKIAKLRGCLDSSLENSREAVSEARRLLPEYDLDLRPLREYKDKLKILEKIAEEAEISLDDMTNYYHETKATLERIRTCRERIAQLGKLVKDSEDKYRHHAHILTQKRIEAGEKLSEAINAGLPPLKLQNAQFRVQVDERPNGTWTEKGFNIVTFMARMNPGQPFSPIAETASGGELARMVLALKAVLQGILTIPTLVFDEVDTGIGGGAAAAVGERLAQLAETTQVLVITHSPQVASRGSQHLHVSKKTDGVTTLSVIRNLTVSERTDEISRMLAGSEITAESHAAAKRLLDEAAEFAQSRRGAAAQAGQH